MGGRRGLGVLEKQPKRQNFPKEMVENEEPAVRISNFRVKYSNVVFGATNGG